MRVLNQIVTVAPLFQVKGRVGYDVIDLQILVLIFKEGVRRKLSQAHLRQLVGGAVLLLARMSILVCILYRTSL